MPPAAAPAAPISKTTAPPAPAVLGTRNSPSFSKVSTPLNLILVEQQRSKRYLSAFRHYTRILRIPSPDTIAFPLSVVQIQAYEASATVDYVVRGG